VEFSASGHLVYRVLISRRLVWVSFNDTGLLGTDWLSEIVLTVLNYLFTHHECFLFLVLLHRVWGHENLPNVFSANFRCLVFIELLLLG
jgi:hypothetical protein